MQRISAVNEVLSLFGFQPQTRQAESSANHSLAFSLLGAFLIVMTVALSLGWYSGTLGASSSAGQGLEKAAFQPGQYVSSRISAGYIGAYR